MAVTLANVITFVRLLLTTAFFIAVTRGSVKAGIIFFTVAWLLDVADGLAARALHQETVFGYFFDKVVDRILIVGAVLILIFTQYLPPMALLLLVKDVLVIPAAVRRWRAGQRDIDLGYLGKLLAVVQGGAVLWLYFMLPYPVVIVLFTAGLGFYAALIYNRPTQHKIA